MIRLTILFLIFLFQDSLQTVRYVIDGDTIILENDTRVRLIGIDCPESVPSLFRDVEPYGKIATDCTRKRLTGRKVKLTYDQEKTDRYGRTLAYVFVNDTLINAELVRLGHAKVTIYPPNTRYELLFKELEQEAKRKKIGMWRF